MYTNLRIIEKMYKNFEKCNTGISEMTDKIKYI